MNNLLTIITVTKDDYEGACSTMRSTRRLRNEHGLRQVIIDSSSEATAVKLRNIAGEENNIDYVWQEPSGIAKAFNMGLRLAKAEWVWFLNGGDQVHPDIDAHNFIYIISQSKADAIIFDLELVPSGVTRSHPPLWALWPPLSAWIPHPATITRQNLYATYGTFTETYEIAMDFDFWLRCFSKNVRVDMLSIPLTKFDTGGRSNSDYAKISSEALSGIKEHGWNLIRIWLMNGVFMVKTFWNYLRGLKGGDV
jgi:hypothetical protein